VGLQNKQTKVNSNQPQNEFLDQVGPEQALTTRVEGRRGILQTLDVKTVLAAHFQIAPEL
jgi:hypothetical protein